MFCFINVSPYGTVAIATDKEKTTPVRGPWATEDTASSNEIKPPISPDQLETDRPKLLQKPTARRSERDDGYQTTEIIETL